MHAAPVIARQAAPPLDLAVLFLGSRRGASGSIPITVTVDGRPKWVGIDPYNKRIDRNSDDNLTQVDLPR